MPRFLDNRGRAWSVDLTVDGLLRIREYLGIELMDVLQDADVRMQVNVLYCICLPQALTMKRPWYRRRRSPDVDFGRSLRGVLPEATAALVQAIDNFLPPPKESEAPVPSTKPLGRLCWEAIYRCAGIVGIDPGPLTLRELAAMAEARTLADWEHTSSLLAHMLNVRAGKVVSSPNEYNPYKPAPKLRKIKAGEAANLIFGRDA